MKLESVEINDFRGIRHLRLDFQDELGLVRDRTVLVGPNASGKTSILDAIAVCLVPSAEPGFPRPRLILSPASIVRHGAVQTSVRCTVCFEDTELETARELYQRVGWPYGRDVPRTREVTVEWTYPDLKGEYPSGRWQIEPTEALMLFAVRLTAARSVHVPGVTPHLFERFGGVFSFDQQRTGPTVSLRRTNPALTRPASESGSSSPGEGLGNGCDARGEDSHYSNDPRTILISLAARAQAQQDAETTDREDYERLCRLYARICHPHRIVGLVNTAHGLDLEFADEQGSRYRYDGLSSGQEMILMMLLQFATRHIHRSIVLIDELELHADPLWQDRLYYALGELGLDNQFILTTHSTHLRDGIPSDLMYHTDELEERAPVPAKG